MPFQLPQSPIFPPMPVFTLADLPDPSQPAHRPPSSPRLNPEQLWSWIFGFIRYPALVTSAETQIASSHTSRAAAECESPARECLVAKVCDRVPQGTAPFRRTYAKPLRSDRSRTTH